MSFLNPTQAAKILGIAPDTVRAYARNGLVPARKIGKHWRFLEADLYRVGIKNQAPCSTNVLAIRLGGLGSESVDARLDAALARGTSPKPSALSNGSAMPRGLKPS